MAPIVLLEYTESEGVTFLTMSFLPDHQRWASYPKQESESTSIRPVLAMPLYLYQWVVA